MAVGRQRHDSSELSDAGSRPSGGGSLSLLLPGKQRLVPTSLFGTTEGHCAAGMRPCPTQIQGQWGRRGILINRKQVKEIAPAMATGRARLQAYQESQSQKRKIAA